MQTAIAEAEALANSIKGSDSGEAAVQTAYHLFHLRRVSKQYPQLTMAWLTAVLLSSKCEADLLRANPYLPDAAAVPQLVLAALLHTNRYYMANQAISQVCLYGITPHLNRARSGG